jgi:anti-sigma regulatory factor (Ser/Thr protein kinase)
LTGDPYRIAAPADPAFAATLRAFVRGSAERLGLGEGDVEDLSLIATELLANAVESGATQVTLALDADAEGWRLRAEGVGTFRDDPDAAVSRGDILRGIADLAWSNDVLLVRPLVAAEP